MEREQFAELLNDPELSYLVCDTKHGKDYTFDGLSLRLNKTGYTIRGNVVGHYSAASHQKIGTHKYNASSLQLLKDFLLVTKEFNRWRSFEGMNVPEILFAVGEAAFFASDLHPFQRDHLSMYAYYQFDSVNSNEMVRRKIHQESGTREKFCGEKRQWLPKASVFSSYFAKEFKPHCPDTSYAPLNYLSRTPDVAYAMLRVEQETVCVDPYTVAHYRVDMPKPKNIISYYVVEIPRAQKNAMMGIFE